MRGHQERTNARGAHGLIRVKGGGSGMSGRGQVKPHKQTLTGVDGRSLPCQQRTLAESQADD
jgi:hypothetical protein